MTSTKKLLLIGVFSLLISGCQNSAEKAQAYLIKGIDYYKQGDNVKARIELKNAIQADNKKAQAFYYLALVDEKDQNWQGMFENLQQSIGLNPNYNEARIKLGQIYLLSNLQNFDKVTEQINAVLKNAVNDPAALILKAVVLTKQKKVADAIAVIDAVLKDHPDFQDALVLKASIYVEKNDLATALHIVDKALTTKKLDDLSLHILKLYIHDRAKDKAAIEQDYLDLIKQFPDKLEFNFALSQYYSAVGQEDKAVKVLQDTIRKNPTLLIAKLAFVDYLLAKNRTQVEATIKSYLIQHVNEPELLFRLANFYLQERKQVQAKEQLHLIISEKKDSKEALNAKLLLAELALAEDKSPQHEAVIAMIKDVLAVNPIHFEALLLKAQITLSKGLYDDGIKDLQDILTNYPKSDQAFVLLAKAHLMKKSPELAEENFYKALSINPSNLDALLPVLGKLMQNKDHIRAAELVKKGLLIQPNNLQLLAILAQIKLSDSDWNEVQKIADEFAKKPGMSAFASDLKGKVLQGQQNYGSAVTQYQEALTGNPQLLDALQGIIQSNEKLNKRGATFAIVEEQIKAHPDNPVLILVKAELLVSDKRPDLAIKVLTEAIAKWPKNPQFYIELAKLYALPKDSAQVIALYNQALANMPENLDFKMLLAGVYDQKQDYASALKLYEELLVLRPHADMPANNVASSLLDHYPSKENITRAVELSKRFEKSENPYFLDTYAWALLNNAQYDQAVQLLQKVIAKDNSDAAVFRYHLGVAYHKTNHEIAAIGELEQALALGEKAGGFAEKKQVEDLLQEIKSAH